MCVAVPARIIAISGGDAEVDAGVARRHVSLWLTPDACVGDYVYIHTGFSISVLDEDEALESLRLLNDLLDAHPAGELFRTAGGHEG